MRAPMMAAAALLVLAGCTLDEEPTAPGRDRLVVHLVLNPQHLDHVLLLERTLSGRETPDSTLAFDSTDAVVSRGGVPVTGATVVITSETGDSAVAVEDFARRGDGKGAGMYRFRNLAADQQPGDSIVAIVPGARYTLRIETPDGETVRGETVVPTAQFEQPPASGLPFNRDRDSVFVYWDPVPGAARYSVHVDGARGPFQLFVDSTEYLVAGTLRNTDAIGLPAVFYPGFVQRVTVGAVDRNFFDYYRSANDPYTGGGLISHLDGALGVFGAYVLVHADRLAVVEDFGDEPYEADYVRAVPFARTPGIPDRFRLYHESTEGASRRFTGNWQGLGTGTPSPGVLAETSDILNFRVVLLAGQSARDTLSVLHLRDNGAGRLVGRVGESGPNVEFQIVPPGD